jgi:hypothetical protein
MSSLNPVDGLLDLGKTALNKIWPDAGEEEKQKVTLVLAELQARSSLVLAEINSDSWLAKNWRPLLMLTFAGLIVARWLGFAAPNLSEAEILKLWGIIEVSVGGYTIGRSAEKILPEVVSAMTNKNR